MRMSWTSWTSVGVGWWYPPETEGDEEEEGEGEGRIALRAEWSWPIVMRCDAMGVLVRVKK